MNDRLDRLLVAVRAARMDTSRVELGFEARLLSRIRAQREETALWGAWAWRLIPAFAALVIVLGLLNLVSQPADVWPALLDDPETTLWIGGQTGE
ncbi:MAG: hypothetical protein C0404_04270 [Verrucomicrobia bacterium]|nr:hypothetical protein [Verrucomicrobiota bacterium]